MTHRYFPTFFILPVLFLAGCESGPSLQERLARAQSLQPDDPALAEIYQRSCQSCHTLEATGAPLTGDQHAWSVRYEKGEAHLLNSVIEGFGGMPPLGLCMDCTQQDFQRLVRFMADQLAQSSHTRAL